MPHHLHCCIAIFLTLVGLVACAGNRPATQPVVRLGNSPQEVFEQMREYERIGDFDAYVACMTDRGRGWLIANMANGLLLDAYDQPVNPTAGAGSRAILEKYGMTDLVQQIRQLPPAGGQDELYRFLADEFGPRLAEFLHDYKAIHPPFFPGRIRDQLGLADVRANGFDF